MILVSGLPKQGFKTWLSLWLAQMVASGRGYASDKGGVWRPCKAQKVLFFEEEGAGIAAKERIFKVAMGLGLPLGAEKQLLPLQEGDSPSDPDRAYDWQPRILKPDPFFDNFLFAHDSGIKLDKPSRVGALVDLVHASKAALVVLDSLTFMFNGDENSKQDMAVVVDAIKQIRSAGASVMYLVHLRKNDEDTDDVDKVLRGHTILRDAYDLHLAARRPKDRDVISLHCRYRDGRRRKFELFWHIPDEGEMGPVVLDLAEVSDSKTKKGLAAGADTDLGGRLLKAGWKPGLAYGIQKFEKDLGLTSGKAVEERNRLLQEGVLLLAPDGKSIILT